jgi:hypothetical protein
VSTTKKKPPTILDAAFIGTPREVWEGREDPATGETSRVLSGWTANVSVIDCAVPASEEAAVALFVRLQEDQPGETVDMEEAVNAYRRSLPPPLPPPPPPEPRKFSVKSVAAKIRELGYTAQVREALMSANGYEMYVGANYLKEDDQDFREMKALVQNITGLDNNAIEAILEDCIWEA